MGANGLSGLVVEISWPRLPAGLRGPGELADQLHADLGDRAGIDSFDDYGLAVLVYRPHEVEAVVADVADRLSGIGLPAETFLAWHDELGEHRRSVTGRRMAAHHKVA